MRGFFDELTDHFGRCYRTELEALESRTEIKLDQRISGLDSNGLDSLISSIREQRQLVSTGAAYGNEIVSTSKQILAFGAAGIGFTAAFSRDLASLPPAFLKLVGIAALFYFNLTALSFFTLFGFLWQTRFRYPFLYFARIGNTRRYFYYRAISPATPRTIFQTAKEKMAGAELYADDLLAFFEHSLPGKPEQQTPDRVNEPGIQRKRMAVRDELQQYFLLLSYQGYINQYEVRMNNQFLYGLISSLVAAGAIAVYAFWPR